MYIRLLIIPLLLFVLSNCTNVAKNYFSPTVQSWRGAHVSTLVERWGMPDQKMSTLAGDTVYIYKTRNYRSISGVNMTRIGKNIIKNGTFVYYPWRKRRALMIACVTAFEANESGFINNVETRGSGCFCNADFSKKMTRKRSQ